PPPLEHAVEEPAQVVVLHAVVAVASVRVDRYVRGHWRPCGTVAEDGDPQRPSNTRQILPHLPTFRGKVPVSEGPGADGERGKQAEACEQPRQPYCDGSLHCSLDRLRVEKHCTAAPATRRPSLHPRDGPYPGTRR